MKCASCSWDGTPDAHTCPNCGECSWLPPPPVLTRKQAAAVAKESARQQKARMLGPEYVEALLSESPSSEETE